MKKTIFAFVTMILFSVSLVGCGGADMEGIVLEVSEVEIKLAENLTPQKYEEIENESVTIIQSEDVEGKRESLELIDLTYDNATEFSKGDEVEVWIDGDIMSSYPGQADARKITLKK